MRFPGHRIVKTTVAVFLTALICELIGWPPVFAVITAIVTLEPTVSDSIKKGIVRFPASAIGSFYAVLFIYLFGNSPLTYTLAAALTIITCYRLKLHAGLLVATITAVAMIEVVYDHYLLSFFIRLGTTTIGLTVSTLVNLLIFPPNFMKEINKNLRNIYIDIGHTLFSLLQSDEKIIDKKMKKLQNSISKTEELIRYEISDAKYFRTDEEKQTAISHVEILLEKLRFIQYHLTNLQPIRLKETIFTEEHQQIIRDSVEALASYITGKSEVNPFHYELKLREIMDSYWIEGLTPNEADQVELPKELVLLYELISIFYLVNKLSTEKNARVLIKIQ